MQEVPTHTWAAALPWCRRNAHATLCFAQDYINFLLFSWIHVYRNWLLSLTGRATKSQIIGSLAFQEIAKAIWEKQRQKLLFIILYISVYSQILIIYLDFHLFSPCLVFHIHFLSLTDIFFFFGTPMTKYITLQQLNIHQPSNSQCLCNPQYLIVEDKCTWLYPKGKQLS